MKWTTDTPNKDGLYWWQPDSQSVEPAAVKIQGGLVLYHSIHSQVSLKNLTGRWLGPISPQQIEAVLEHYSQKADDLCWLDDNKLYDAFDLPPRYPEIGDPDAMLKNCQRFISQRCLAGGNWKSYAELEQEIKNWEAAYSSLLSANAEHWDTMKRQEEENTALLADIQSWKLANDSLEKELSRLLDALGRQQQLNLQLADRINLQHELLARKALKYQPIRQFLGYLARLLTFWRKK